MRIWFIIICLAFGIGNNAYAQNSKDAFRSTKLPLPRFVSLRADEVFARTGPGKKYPIRYVYENRGLPVEIILEFENWRKIKDFEGDEAWVHQTLLSGKRTALIKGTEPVSLYRKPDIDSRKAAVLQPQSRLRLESCDGIWCEANAAGYDGWVRQKFLWGVYEKEIFD